MLVNPVSLFAITDTVNSDGVGGLLEEDAMIAGGGGVVLRTRR
jgi:hypothetical protein